MVLTHVKRDRQEYESGNVSNENPQKKQCMDDGTQRHNEFDRPYIFSTPGSSNSNDKGQVTSFSTGNIPDRQGSTSEFKSQALSIKDGEGSVTKKLAFDSSEQKGDMAIQACLEMVDGEYVLKLKKVQTSSESERAYQLANSGALLLFQGEMLCNLGRQLLSNFQASFESIIRIPEPSE